MIISFSIRRLPFLAVVFACAALPNAVHAEESESGAVIWQTDVEYANPDEQHLQLELLTLPGAGHGFKGADQERAEQALIEFFDRHLKSTKSS